MELEVCKREVVKERTRILERDEASVLQREADNARAKGKGKSECLIPFAFFNADGLAQRSSP